MFLGFNFSLIKIQSLFLLTSYNTQVHISIPSLDPIAVYIIWVIIKDTRQIHSNNIKAQYTSNPQSLIDFIPTIVFILYIQAGFHYNVWVKTVPCIFFFYPFRQSRYNHNFTLTQYQKLVPILIPIMYPMAIFIIFSVIKYTYQSHSIIIKAQ